MISNGSDQGRDRLSYPKPDTVFSSLWITRFAQYSGSEGLAKRLGYAQYGPYIFVSLLFFVDHGILLTLGAWHSGTVHWIVENPFALLALFGLLFLTWSIRELVVNYHDIKDSEILKKSTEDGPENNGSQGLIVRLSNKQIQLKYFFLTVLIIAHMMNFFVFRGVTVFFDRLGPVIGTLRGGAIFPIFYFPLIAEFVSILVFYFVVIPYYFAKEEYPLQFDDPLDIGGLEPVGKLMKKSIYVYCFGLILVLMWLYGPFIFSTLQNNYPTFGWEITAQFVIAWAGGIILFLFGAFRLHIYMQNEKENKIKEITGEIRELGDDDHSIPETEVTGEERPKLEMKKMKIEKIRQMRTWPFTTATQERIVLSAGVPIIFDRFLNIFLF